MGKKRAPNGGTGGLFASLVAATAFLAVAVGAWRTRGEPVCLDEDPEARTPPRWLAAVDRWQRSRPVPAFVLAVLRKFSEDRAGYLAALVSYFAFFSLFPLLMALTSVLGMVLEGNEELQDKITGTATAQIPIIGKDLAVGEISGSTFAVVIGIAVSLWSGLKVIDAAQNALNDVWDVPMIVRPSLVKRRARSVVLLGVFGLSLLASLVSGTLAGLLPDLAGQGRISLYLLTMALNFGVFLVAFKSLSQLDHTWAELVPGSAFASAGWFVVQVPGAFYIQRIIDSSSGTYTNFATVIGLLTFFFLASQVVIIGAEINVVRARRLWPRSLLAKYGDLTAADERAYAAAAAATKRLPSQQVVVGFGPHRRLR